MNAETARPLRILLVVSSYLPNLGGLQQVTSALASELQRQGHTILVLANRYPWSLAAHEEIDGIAVKRLLFLVPRLHQVQDGRADLAAAGLFVFPATLMRLIAMMAQFRPDVVNLHFVGAPAVFLVLARKFLRFKFIVSLHGDDVEGYTRGTWFDRWVMHATLGEADAVTACSRYLLNAARAIAPGIATKSGVVYNGVDLPASQSNGRADGALVAVGRLMPKKGFDVLLQAMDLLRASGSSPHLTLIGDGPERVRLEDQVRRLMLDSVVEMCGPKDRAAVRQAIHASRLVVIPSRQEPFGMVALEAMAEGKPVVATRAGGLPEVLDGAAAQLVEPGDAAALAEAIRGLLSRIGSDPLFGADNRAVAACFSLERMTDRYLAIYANPGAAASG